MGPAALRLLQQRIQIRYLPVSILPAGFILHHYGTLDVNRHVLWKPIWVSDDLEFAQKYRNYEDPAHFHTTLIVRSDLKVVDLTGVQLQPIASELNMPSSQVWNNCLASYLRRHRLKALLSARHEIFLAAPGKSTIRSRSRSAELRHRPPVVSW